MNKYFPSLVFGLLLFFSTKILAQYDATPSQIDSLKTLLSSTPRDTTHTSILTNLWRAHIDHDIDQAFHYGRELIRLGKELNHVPSEYTGYQRMGIAYSYIDDYDKSNEYYEKGLKLSIEHEEYSCIAVMHYNMALNFSIQNKYDSTLYHNKKSAKYFLKVNDSTGYAGCQNRIGSLYFQKGQYKLSLEYTLEAMKIYERYDDERARRSAGYNRNSVALNYLKMKDTVSAVEYYEKNKEAYVNVNDQHGLLFTLTQLGLIYSNKIQTHVKAAEMLSESEKIAKTMKMPSGLISSYYGQGFYHFKRKEFEISEKYLVESLRLSDSLEQKANSIDNKLLLAEIFLEQKKYQQALQLTKEVLELSKEEGFLEDQVKAFRILYKAFQKTGDYPNALKNHELFKAYNDSIYNLESSQKMSELQTIYETEKKEAALALQEEEINTLNEKAKVDKLTKGLYAGGMASALALFGLSVFGYRQRIKKNRIAREKQEEIYKQEIAHKKKELTSQTLHLVQKNTFIQELKENLENLKNSPDKFKAEFRRIVMLLKKENASDKDWEVFKTYFADVHNDFDQKLKTLYANISEKEIRLAAFLRMNLTTKEIAATLNVLPDSILKSKYRLKKKLGLDKETDLSSFLASL